MNEELHHLIRHGIARAKEAVEEARVLADSGHWNACVSRLYYACFYAVSALLSKHDVYSSKHSGIRSLFNHNFVKTGILPRETAVIYNSLFERRQEGDYELLITFREADVRPWLRDTEVFIDAVICQIETGARRP